MNRYIVLGALLILLSGRASAYMVQNRTNLPELLAANQIFSGKVLEKYEQMDECEHLSDYTVIEIIEGIKNVSGSTIVVKRFGKIGPALTPGRSYLVFLSKPSEPCHYTNPVSLDAGLFTVKQNAAGVTEVVNGVNNRLLFPQISAATSRVVATDPKFRALLAHEQGPVSYELLRDFIKKAQP